MKNYIVLDSEKNKKPLDIGCGALSASVGYDGRLCAVNGFHSKHGFVTLNSLEPFDNAKWYDSNYVRQYRRNIATESPSNNSGFGFIPDFKDLKQTFLYDGCTIPTIVGQEKPFKWKGTYHTVSIAGESWISHQVTVQNTDRSQNAFPYRFGGLFSFNRSSYGQLTEAGPIPLPNQMNHFLCQGNWISVHNPDLNATAEMYAFEETRPLQLSDWQLSSDKSIPYETALNLILEAGETKRLCFLYRVHSGEAARTDPAILEVHYPDDSYDFPSEHLIGDHVEPLTEQEWAEFVIKRNLDYILSCCAVPVEGEAICILTDHQLLPLSWNRDSYYMMTLLITADKTTSWPTIEKNDRFATIVKGHLLWMFEQAERPNGYWGRAYLTNGYCKDNVFQLDQQCYPLLQLCDYYEWTKDEELIQRIVPKLKGVLNDILVHRHTIEWLFRTGETPADDKVDFPYHFSSQVLIWHTFRKLHELNTKFAFMDMDLNDCARLVKTSCLKHFKVMNQGKELFAYLTDLNGNHQCYHDANDLPTVLAPVWGFTEADDATWLNTMEYGFSSGNNGGFYPGKFGGLGSVHTPHSWPLGDAQELLFSALVKDSKRYRKVMGKLSQISFWDGMFSEAIDEHTGSIASRHWFSWPGSFLSHVLLSTSLVD